MKQYNTSVYQDEVSGKYACLDTTGRVVTLVDNIHDATELYGITWHMVKFENDGEAHFVPVDIVVERIIRIRE
jgi:hypothetical protein